MKKLPICAGALLLALGSGPGAARAWDYDGHRAVNELALAALPADFPAFPLTPAARERIVYLGGEPDRWRNVADVTLRHYNGPDHYFDVDALAAYGMDPHALPRFRYVFTAQLALARAAHPEKFPAIDPAWNDDHTRELPGFLPWAILENFDKLKSGFASLKAFQAYGGTPEEIANAQQDILYVMGVMGHYVGDAAQPLHTTLNYNGWVGPNPRGYTTDNRLHALIDGGYFQKTGGIDAAETRRLIRPAAMLSDAWPAEKTGDAFAIICDYVAEQFKQVEPLYQMEKDGKFSGEGELGREGRAFLHGQLAKGGQMLGNLWYTAWRTAPEDIFLKSALARRALTQTNAPVKR